MIGRRKFIGLLGGGVVLAASGAIWASTRHAVGARAPWSEAGQGEGDVRRQVLSYAILAPNPHNRQPWLADLSARNEITVFCQEDRRLPETDPFDRQITIGLGCFLELLVQAAAQYGWKAGIELFPEGEARPRLDRRPVARIRLTEERSIARDPLFAYVLERRTNRNAHDTARPVTAQTLTQIAAAARKVSVAATQEPGLVSRLRGQTWDAMRLELSTRETMQESLDLLRIGRAEIEANPDGISLEGPMIELAATLGLLSRRDMLDTNSSGFRQQLDALKPGFDTAMAFIWLKTSGDSRLDQIAAGRDYVRINLAATRDGLAMQPFSQALQEFPKMRPHYDLMRRSLGIGQNETLQMLARVGYAAQVEPSPRWSAASRIMPT